MSARGFGGWLRSSCLPGTRWVVCERVAGAIDRQLPALTRLSQRAGAGARSFFRVHSERISVRKPTRTTDTRTDLENRAAADATSAPQPAPRSFGSGVYPALLPYREGLPIPLGYHVEHRSANGLIGAGLASLIISYTAAIVLGASANFKDGTGWLVLPVVGPWAAIGARSYHCDNNPLHANQCVSGASARCKRSPSCLAMP